MKVKSVVMRRTASLILSAALVFPMVVSFPAESYAAVKKDDNEAVKSIAYNVFGKDIHYYSDDFFRGDSEPYNASLATLSYMVCNMSYSSHGDPNDQCQDLREFLQDNGFTDFDVNEDYTVESSLTTSAVACAHKKITDNGKEYTLLAVIPRSGTFGAEFERSLYLSKNPNDISDHAGYDACKDKVVDFVHEYMKKYGIKGNLKVWTTGYSGGGGVSNLFSAELIRFPAYVVGNPYFKSCDLYDYNFSPMRAASVQSDPKDSKYDCMHNVLDDADLLMKLPTSDSFDRYGKDYRYRDEASKEDTLRMMQADNYWIYNSYVTEQDPDLFMTYKPDVEKLISEGQLVTVPDPDSYLLDDQGNPDQAVYLKGVEDAIISVCEQAGDGDGRKGFYNEYQEPMMDLVGFFFKDGVNYDGLNVLMNALTGTKTSIPLVLSMYTSFMVNKSMNDKSADFDKLIEQSFNRLASEIENEDGSLKDRYKGFSGYNYIVNTYFAENTDGTEGKYHLKKTFSYSEKSLLLQKLKELTGDLYAASFGEALRTAGTDEETISRLTSEDASEASAFFLANILFGNGMQSRKIEPLKLDNEQFCQTATFMGNMYKFITLHMFYFLMDWCRAADPYYTDFCKGTGAQNAGYRRVFVTQPEGVSVSGTVKDSSGNTVASFKNGKLESRSDEWIGMTTSDSGNWLRLPLDQSYKVAIKISRDADLDLRIADYSIDNGAEVRTDKKRSWKVKAAKASDTYTLDIPAVEESGGSYDMAGAVYSLDVTNDKPSSDGSGSSSGNADNNSQNNGQTVDTAVTGQTEESIIVYHKSIPAVKNVSVKTGKNSFTVKWKKLSPNQRKKFSKVQIQYSTSRDFSNAKTVNVKKSKTSYKIKKLKKGKTYYVRVRNIKKSGAATLVSKWSKAKKIKVK